MSIADIMLNGSISFAAIGLWFLAGQVSRIADALHGKIESTDEDEED